MVLHLQKFLKCHNWLRVMWHKNGCWVKPVCFTESTDGFMAKTVGAASHPACQQPVKLICVHGVTIARVEIVSCSFNVALITTAVETHRTASGTNLPSSSQSEFGTTGRQEAATTLLVKHLQVSPLRQTAWVPLQHQGSKFRVWLQRQQSDWLFFVFFFLLKPVLIIF